MDEKDSRQDGCKGGIMDIVEPIRKTPDRTEVKVG